MAVAFRASAVTTVTAGETTSTLAMPTGTAAGDFLVAYLPFGVVTSAFTFSAGWNEFSWSPLVDGTSSNTHVLWKIAGASEPALTISWTTSSKGVYVVTAYSGVDNSTPFGNNSGSVSTVSGTSLTTPSLAAVGSTQWALCFFHSRSSTTGNKAATYTPGTGMTERVDANNSAASSAPWVNMEQADSNGAVTAGSHAYTATSTFAESHHFGSLIYLNPAASSTPATGAASLALSAAGVVRAGVTGSAVLTLSATGAAGTSAGTSGTATLALAASAITAAPAAGTAALALTASGSASGSSSGAFSDDFNRADGSLGANWIASGAGPVAIASNQAVSGTTVSTGRWATDTSGDDQFSQYTYVGGIFHGPAVAVGTFASGTSIVNVPALYAFRQQAAGAGCAVVYRDDANVTTVLASSARNMAAGDVMRLEFVGGVLYAYVNGVREITVTPSVVIAAHRGVGFQNNTNPAGGQAAGTALFDDWSGGTATAPLSTPAAGSASLSIVASGAAAASATPTAALSLTASGMATARTVGAASLSLGATGTARAGVTATGSVTLTANATATPPASATAALSLAASATAQTPTAGTAGLTLAASGSTRATAAGTAALALAANGTATQPGGAAGTAALNLTASGTARAATTATAVLTLAATGTTRATSTGTASLTLAATGTTAARVTGAAALSLTATGSANLQATPATGTASLTLTASGTSRATTGATATIKFAAAMTAGARTSGTAALNLTATGSPAATGQATGSLALVATADLAAAANAQATLTLTGTALAEAVDTSGYRDIQLTGTLRPRPWTGAIRARLYAGALNGSTYAAGLTERTYDGTLRPPAYTGSLKE